MFNVDSPYMTRARVHEAAHAVAMARLFSASRIRSLSVNEDASGWCSTTTLPTDPDSLMRNLCMTLAGSVMARGASWAEPRELGCAGDTAASESLARRLAGLTARSAFAILEEADLAAERLVERDGGAIACLAESLRLAGDRLEGAALQLALAAALEGETWRAAEPDDEDEEQAAASPTLEEILEGPAPALPRFSRRPWRQWEAASRKLPRFATFADLQLALGTRNTWRGAFDLARALVHERIASMAAIRIAAGRVRHE